MNGCGIPETEQEALIRREQNRLRGIDTYRDWIINEHRIQRERTGYIGAFEYAYRVESLTDAEWNSLIDQARQADADGSFHTVQLPCTGEWFHVRQTRDANGVNWLDIRRSEVR